MVLIFFNNYLDQYLSFYLIITPHNKILLSIVKVAILISMNQKLFVSSFIVLFQLLQFKLFKINYTCWLYQR